MEDRKAILIQQFNSPWFKVYFPYNQVLVENFKELIPKNARRFKGDNENDVHWLVKDTFKQKCIDMLEEFYEIDLRTAVPEPKYPDDISRTLATELLDVRARNLLLIEELEAITRSRNIWQRKAERLETEGSGHTQVRVEYRDRPSTTLINSAQSIEFLFKALSPTQHLKLYKQLSQALHPDTGGSNDLMRDLNTVWDRYKRNFK